MTGLGIVALAGIVVKNGIVLIDTYNHYNRDDGVEPVKAMLHHRQPACAAGAAHRDGDGAGRHPDGAQRRVRLHPPRDRGRRPRRFVVHRTSSAALVSGLFVSTALTLVMVPVMITAPSVLWSSIAGATSSWSVVSSPVSARRSPRSGAAPPSRPMAPRSRFRPTPPSPADKVPAGVDSAAKYLEADRTGLVETDQDGVTVVSRQAAE